ncbi:MAG: Spy/CpxP family protein refolding chaperone [Syntrophales bacterium]
MKLKDYQVAFPVTLVVVMVAFLSTIFFASASLSFAATGKKKSSAVARPSAVEYTEAQIKKLQGALKITEAQEELWNNLTQVMRENATDMDALTDSLAKERAEGGKTMSAVEHMKLHSQITEARSDQLKKLIPPLEEFYASLSDGQKKTIDAIFRAEKHGKHKRK